MKHYFSSIFILSLVLAIISSCESSEFSEGSATRVKQTGDAVATTEENSALDNENDLDFDEVGGTGELTEGQEDSTGGGGEISEGETTAEDESDLDLGEGETQADETKLEIEENETFIERCKDTHSKFTSVDLTPLTFPATATCPFGVGDNAGRKQGYPAARTETVQNIVLPADLAEVCSMTLRGSNSNFSYDDAVIFTIGAKKDATVVSEPLVFGAGAYIENFLEAHLDKADEGTGHFIYDWSKLYDQSYSRTSKFCAQGAGACSVPETEGQGLLSFDLQPEWFEIAKFFENPTKPNTLPVVVAVTGNGSRSNPNDCQHSGVVFNVTLKYLKK